MTKVRQFLSLFMELWYKFLPKRVADVYIAPEYVKLRVIRQVHLPNGIQRHIDDIIIRNSYTYFKENKLVRELVYSILAQGGRYPIDALENFRFEYGLVYSADNPYSGYLCMLCVFPPTPNELLLFTEE